MCLNNSDVLNQKFGFQISEHQTGLTNEQKALNGFRPTVYTPTNWHTNGWETWRAKFPQFLRFGGLVPVAPEYFQKNYLGIYPIGKQPLVNEPNPYDSTRLS